MCGICEGIMSSLCPSCREDEYRDEVCPDCEGIKTFVSDCCGEPIFPDTDICSGCRGHCGSEEEVCERCKGEGIILVEI